MISHILVYVTAVLLISIAPWQSWFDHTGDKKSPPPDMEKELMMEVWHVLQNEEKVVCCSSPTYSLIIKL